MAVRKASPPSGRKGRGGGPSVPLWLVLALILTLALVIFLRCRVTPKPEPKPEVKTPAQTTPSPKKPAAKKPHAPAPEPPPAPESPLADKAPAPPAPLPPGGQRTICLVIDDVGYSLDLANAAGEKLPKETTFAVIPFLPYSEDSARLFHESGHHVILHCPMEPERSGQWRATPGTLLVGMPPAEVSAILEQDLKAVPFAEGINNHMGSLATTDRPLMAVVCGDLKGRGLYFLDSRTSARTVAYDEAHRLGLKAAFRSVFLDDVDEDGAIIRQIDLWAARSAKEGAPVAIGHLRPRTIEALAFRLPYWRAQGVRLVPLCEVVR